MKQSLQGILDFSEQKFAANFFPCVLVCVLACFWAQAAQAGERYSVQDEGGFSSTGRLVEVPDRYHWQSYEIKFDFSLDMESRSLTKDSTLSLKLLMKDDRVWSYRCRASDRRKMWANINQIFGKGISVLAECAVSPESFAKSMGLNPELVGQPVVVFHATIQRGVAKSGSQKGIYFVSSAKLHKGPLSPYASRNADPSELGVLFTSRPPHLLHSRGLRTSRWLP
jgi:hypothetical protein